MKIKQRYQKNVIAAVIALLFGVVLVYAMTGVHSFGDIDDNSLAQAYLYNGLNQTGSTNIVNSIIWDFRGFDTLGEEIVFFTAVIAISAVVLGFRETKGKEKIEEKDSK